MKYRHWLLSLCCLGLLTAICGAEEKVVKLDELKSWSAWGHTSPIDIAGDNAPGSFIFTRRLGGRGWNCPAYRLPAPVPVTENLGITFRYRAEVTGGCELHFHNETDGGDYSVLFNVTGTDWQEQSFIIADSVFKSGGRRGVALTGMENGKLTKISFNFHGEHVRLSDIRLHRLTAEQMKALRKRPVHVDEYAASRQMPDYRKYKRNGIFPIGMLCNVRVGDEQNGKLFNQTFNERLEEDLLDIRSRGMNAIANFCCGGFLSVGERLKLMEKYDMFLLETATCSAKLYRTPEESALSGEVRKYSSHPRLLAWYGQDEATDPADYIKNKRWIDERAGEGAATTSALCFMPVVRTLGPAMDIMLLDPYNLIVHTPANESAEVLAQHTLQIKTAYEACAGKRVWIILQGYSDLANRNQGFRLDTPAEARYDLYNAVASGANGVFYYIYNNVPAYYAGTGSVPPNIEVESLSDPWQNASPQLEAISEAAPRLTAIMPSFLQRRPFVRTPSVAADVKSVQLHCWDNGDGMVIFAVNSDLKSEKTGKLQLTLPAGSKLYDLDRLAESAAGEFTLTPGGCGIFFAGEPAAFEKIRGEIQARRAADEKFRRELAVAEPAELKAVRQAFGRMHQRLSAYLLAGKTPETALLADIRKRISKYSARYFQARRDWRAGRDFDRKITELIPLIDQISF